MTGEGIEGLREFLLAQAAEMAHRQAGSNFRLAVDRAFSLSGIGTIVTGTAHAGAVVVGEAVNITPLTGSSRLQARVRSVHAQDQAAQQGGAGQRLALNLVGVAVEEIPRGSWITSADLNHGVQRFDIALTVSALHDRSIGQGLEVHLHHGAADVMARIYPLDVDRAQPGAECFASVVVSDSLSICRGDRLILRDSQAQTTLAGARVLDISPPHRGRRSASRLACLQSLRAFDDAKCLTVMAGIAPIAIARLCQGWNTTEQALVQLAGQAGLRVAAGMIFHPDQWTAYQDRLILAIDEIHAREPEMQGLEVNRARRVAAPQLDSDAFDALIDQLMAEQRLERRGAFLARPGHTVELSKAEENLWKSIAPLLSESPYNPPRVRDIAKLTHIPESEIRANLRRVARLGEITLVALDHFFLTVHVSEMARIARGLQDQHGAVRAADFRDQIGGGRKVAIQILEFFDRVGYTRRVRDDHLIRRDNPFVIH
jgi:selenocysteine-specific elongation factor